MSRTRGFESHPLRQRRDAREAEGARLEIVCALKAHRGFESHSLRHKAIKIGSRALYNGNL